MTSSDDLVLQARRQLHAPFEAAVASTDQLIASLVRDGLAEVRMLAVWEQWKAAERGRKRLEATHGDGLDLLDF